MDYLKIYKALIHKARKEYRIKHTGQYYEIHHIVPKSLGGSNRSHNKVLLTAKEHFIAHHLLFKHTVKFPYKDWSYKMALAFRRLSKGSWSHKKRDFISTVTAKTYSIVKEHISTKMLGEGNPMYGKVNNQKGTTFSEERLKLHKKASLHTRKRSNIYLTWYNTKTQAIEENVTIYMLAEKYGICSKKFHDVLDPTTPRKTHLGWQIIGRDNRNKKMRDADNKTYALWEHTTTAEQFIGTAYELAVHINSLNVYTSYRELLIVAKQGKQKTAYGWKIKEKYEKTIDDKTRL